MRHDIKKRIGFRSQKGVALLIAFFVIGIAVSVVLGVCAILFSEIKVIRQIGDSVKAFYAADTGVEQFFYFDNKKKPAGASRGFCNICNICSEFNCQNCQSSGTDCDPVTCLDCQVSYSTEIGDKKFDIICNITLTEENIKSFGTFLKTTRAIGLDLLLSAGGQ